MHFGQPPLPRANPDVARGRHGRCLSDPSTGPESAAPASMTRSMNRRSTAALLAVLASSFAPLLVGAVPAGSGPAATSDATLAALRAEAAPALGELRAGAPVAHVLKAVDRAELQRADNQSSDLGELRAGELSDNELLIIGITVLAVIVLILIL